MAIPSNLAFDKVVASCSSYAREITAYILYNGSERLMTVEATEIQPSKGDLLLLRSRYISDQFHFEYVFEESGLGAFHEDYLPAPFVWAHDNNPVILQIRHENRISSVSVGPVSVVVWKRVASGTTPATPTEEFAGNVVGLFDALEDDGWTQSVPSGTDVLWHVTVTYSYDHIGDEYETHYSAPSTEAILYSTDGGLNYSATRPDDEDDIDFVGYHTPTGWHYIPYAHEPEATPVTSPYVSFPNDFWQNASTPQSIVIESVPWDDIYRFGFDVRFCLNWANTNVYTARGEPSVKVPHINWAYDGDFADNHQWLRNKTYLMLVDRESGDASLALCDNPLPLSNYGGMGAFLLSFNRYPRSHFTRAETASATALRIASAGGINVGDTLFHGGEQMTVVTIDRTFRGGATRYNDITVTRGVNGTTAEAIPNNRHVRAVYNRDVPRNITVHLRNNVPSYTIVRPWYLTKRGVD